MALKHRFKYIITRVYTYRLHPLFFLTFFIATHTSSAQYYEFNETLQEAYSDILDLNYSNAKQLIDLQLKSTPKHAIALYLKNFNETLPIFIVEDKEAYSKITSHESQVLNTIEKLPNTSPYYYFTQAEIKLHWAMMKLKFGDNTSAALNIRSCYKLLETGLKKYPDFVPMMKTMALLKIVIGSIPENYTWLAGAVGLYGDLNQGVKELTSVANGTSIYHKEAKLWLVLCEHYLLGEEGHLDMLSTLRKTDPQNILYLFLDLSLKIHDAQSQQAFTYYKNNTVNKRAFLLIPSFYYMLGEIYLYKGQYTESITAFKQYINTHKGQAYIKDAYYKIFLSYWFLGNNTEAQRYKTLTLNKGITRNDSDKQALKMVKSETFPAKELYKIRLLTDGGYFEEAIQLCSTLSKDQFNPIDQLEFEYRQARLYHKYGDIERAILYYNNTIKDNGKSDEYFSPNSCLQLGYIYRDLNQTEKAKLYFNSVFDYKNYEYKQTIESKAKAGLSSLEK